MSRKLLLGALSISLVLLAGCETSEEDQVPASAVAASEEGSSEKSLSEESEEMADDCEELDEERYGHLDMEADLNGNGLKDRAMEDLENCGASTCFGAILEACANGGYRKVALIRYFQVIEPLDETTRGWRDLKAYKAGRNDEGLLETTPETYVWNGETYIRAED